MLGVANGEDLSISWAVCLPSRAWLLCVAVLGFALGAATSATATVSGGAVQYLVVKRQLLGADESILGKHRDKNEPFFSPFSFPSFAPPLSPPGMP